MPEPSVSVAPAPLPSAAPAPARGHRWRFHRVGGLDHVVLDSGADLAHLSELDPKLWVALACPTKGLELDPRTLELLDADKDARVRVPEILGAVRWCEVRLDDLGRLLPRSAELPLAAIATATPEGRALLGGARKILASLGKPDALVIGPADVADTSKVFAKTAFNGDGVLPPGAVTDPEGRKVAEEIVACIDPVEDRGGLLGFDAQRVELFFQQLQAFVAWWDEGNATEGAMPLGPATPAAWAAVQAVKGRVEDYFARCDLAALDPRAVMALNRTEADWAALAAKDLAAAAADLAAFPLSRVEPGRPLPLLEGVNPAFADALAALHRDAVAPLLGPGVTSLTRGQWRELEARLALHGAWQAKKAGASVEPLGLLRARAILAGGTRARLEALLAEDLTHAAEANAVEDVVRMVHYHRDLCLLLRNFVAFVDFYDPRTPAVFQAGTLYLDARACSLCIRVDDPAAHAPLAALSRMYIAYCACRRPGGETMNVAACFTQGDSDFLMVGRNGIFVDRKGRDWDATIVKIVDNPISIRQAFFAPYKKFARLLEEQAAKFAASKAAATDEKLAGAAGELTATATGGKPPPPRPEPVDVGKMVGIIAALGVGVGALGTLLGGFVSGFTGLQPWWAKLVAIAGVFLVISGPSMFMAWLKLRQRTLGPVLDATGWAVNGRVKVNIPLGWALTTSASLPPGASRSLEDPFEDRTARRNRRIAWTAVVVLAALLGAARYFHRWPFGPFPPWRGG
jgi:hypothetical protein